MVRSYSDLGSDFARVLRQLVLSWPIPVHYNYWEPLRGEEKEDDEKEEGSPVVKTSFPRGELN